MTPQPDGPSSDPVSPFTQLGVAATQIHELFTSLAESGFTRPEALQITIAIILKGAESS